MLEIKTLGALSIQKNGEILNFSGSSKAEAILAYIALEGRQQSRAGLAAMFWPESSDKNASASLRVVLSSLRKYLGEFLEITRDFVGFEPATSVYLDTTDFERKIAGGDLTQALKLYRGDLLEGVYIQDSNEFENWRRWEQERFRILLIDAAQESISADLIKGNYRNVQNLASELLRIDPLNEVALQQYMIALALDGKRIDALKNYQRYSEILMDELDIKPSIKTETIKNLISKGDLAGLSLQVLPNNNLPHPQTSFIGREAESAHIYNLLKDENCRLLTLVGPGGIGKTRLALHVAGKALNLFSDGVFFIPLENISSPDFLIPTIAENLQFDFDEFFHLSDTIIQLNNFLKDRSILLILDGYEHILAGNPILTELLQSTANLNLLVTSRQKLNLQGEWVYQVSGLPIPEETSGIEEGNSSSLNLFFERMRQSDPSLTLSEENSVAALRICQQVEGFPLGIELAAAWTSILSCVEIAGEIEKSYDFLQSPVLDISERHRSLRTTFNHSWQMLDKEQQEILAKLSVFQGGFSRQAASQITGANLTDLSTLLDKSLLQKVDGRISMHRMIQRFTEENLSDLPEIRQDAYEKHCHYFIEFLLEREGDLDNDKMVVVREEVRREIENLRIAINWAVLQWETNIALKAVRAYFTFYLVQGWHEGLIAFRRLSSWIRENKKDEALDDPVFLSCQAHQGWFSSNLGLIEESETLSQECLGHLQERDMEREWSFCLHNLGVNAEFRGEYELSRKLLEDAVAIGRNDPSVAFPSYYLWLGYIYFMLGEYQEGMKSFKTSYDLFNENGNTWGASFALSKMGLAADGLGEHAAAMEYFYESYQIFVETNDLTGQGYSLSRMSSGAYFLEDYEKAVAFGEQALELFEDIGHRWGACISLCRLGFAYLGNGNIQEAKSKFFTALDQSTLSQLTPLSLYALAGIASVMVLEENEEEGWHLFNYVQSHPKTPALYIDVTRRWFQNISFASQEKSAADDIAPIDRIIESVIKKTLIS